MRAIEFVVEEACDGGAVTGERVTTFERDDLTFDVVDAGPLNGEPVILLHGWPGGLATWDELMPLLVDRGMRVLAPAQRGYSPDARPAGMKRYVMAELVTDVLALIETAGLDRVHVVGHDWGGAVAWTLAEQTPERLSTLTVLSTPHPGALQQAMVTGDQALRSWYMLAFQLPLLPERQLLAHRGRRLQRALERTGLDADRAAAYVVAQRRPGALTASLAWYRALRFARSSKNSAPVGVPTTFVWGSGDAALGRRAAELTERHVAGPYRFEVLEGASHWLPEQHAPEVAALVEARVTSRPTVGGTDPDGQRRERKIE